MGLHYLTFMERNLKNKKELNASRNNEYFWYIQCDPDINSNLNKWVMMCTLFFHQYSTTWIYAMPYWSLNNLEVVRVEKYLEMYLVLPNTWHRFYFYFFTII